MTTAERSGVFMAAPSLRRALSLRQSFYSGHSLTSDPFVHRAHTNALEGQV
jgi:hypothetical protein